MSDPRTWRVWSEHMDEADAVVCFAHTARGALFHVLVEFVDDGDVPGVELGDEEEWDEQWTAADDNGARTVFTVGCIGPGHIGITTADPERAHG